MTTTRKDIARDLDRAAARADMIDACPATSKQCWFLAGLLFDAGESAESVGCGLLNSNAVLTKRQASFYIDQCLADRAKAAA